VTESNWLIATPNSLIQWSFTC